MAKPSLLAWYEERSVVPPQELAEHTEVHLLERATFETIRRDGYVYIAGQRDANLHPYRVDDLEGAVAWSRDESRRRGHKDIEWWIGWTAEPADLAEQLLSCGITRSDDPPTLTGMTSTTEPPAEPSIEVRRVETLEDYLATMEVDWRAWDVEHDDLDERRAREIARFDAMMATGTVHHWAGFLDGKRVGIGRAIDMDDGVALFGGAVLPEARGHGVYRALVHTRWNHAVARGTPLLVVQAGPMSRPVLTGLGFEAHGDIQLYCDRL
jgi:ribosomal protein S18 acetylase RimI-like enzyme